MRASMGLVLLAVPAHAETELQAQQLKIARDAARGNHCEIVLQIGAQLEQNDPAYYETFKVDPVVGICFGLTPPPVEPPPVEPPKPVPPTRDREEPTRAAPPRPTRLVAPEVVVNDVPPLSGARLGGEFVLGGLLAIPGGYLGAVAGLATCDEDDSFDCLAPAVLGIYFGGTLGVAIGVTIVGTVGDETGSFGSAFGGSLIGGLVGLAGQSLQSVWLGAVTGGILAFNLSRRYETPKVQTTVLRFDNAGYGLAVGGAF